MQIIKYKNIWILSTIYGMRLPPNMKSENLTLEANLLLLFFLFSWSSVIIQLLPKGIGKRKSRQWKEIINRK